MFVGEHPVLSAVYFMAIYIVSVILIIPDSTLIILFGGFLFPLPLAVAYSCIAETIGGLLFFLAARLAFLETLGKKKKAELNGIQKKFRGNQAFYLLFLRFSHLIPFWIVNLGAGLLRVKTRTFIWTTLVGVIPFTFLVADSGVGLSKYFETHTHFTFEGIFTTEVKIGLIVLGCFALVPIIIKNWLDTRKKK